MKKILLLILVLAVAFAAIYVLYGRASAPGITPGYEPAPVEDPGDGDEIAWNYDDFPDDYTFRNNKLLTEHYEKHGVEMGFESAEAYAESANLVIHHPDVLWKVEKEDGDYCFFLEETGEFVVLSKDGYIRTYFWPDSGKKYYDKQ